MPATMNATERLLFEDLIRMNEIARRNERLQQQAEQSGANIEASGNTGGLNRDMWARPSDVGVQYNMSTTHNQTWDHNLLERDTILPNDMNQPLASLPMFMLQLNSVNPNTNNTNTSPPMFRMGFPPIPHPPSFVGHGDELSSRASSSPCITPGSTYLYPQHMGNVGRTDSPSSTLESPMLSSEWHDISSRRSPERTELLSDMFGAPYPQLYEPQPQRFHQLQALQQSHQAYQYQHHQHQDHQQEQPKVHSESTGGSSATSSSEDSQDDAQIASSGGKVTTSRQGRRGPRGPYQKKTDAAKQPRIRACPMTGCPFTTVQDARTLRRHVGSCNFNPEALGHMCLGVHDLANQKPCNTPLAGRKDALIDHVDRMHRLHMSATGMQLHFKTFLKSDMDGLKKKKKTSSNNQKYEQEIAEFLGKNESVLTEALVINDNPAESVRRLNTVAACFLF